MITYGGPELLLLLVVFAVTPVLYRVYLHRLERKQKIISIATLWFVTFLGGYTDVIIISLQARKLCREEAGLHVYKTVEAEGFLGSTDIKYWSQYGYKYVEYENVYVGGKKYRSTLVNNEVRKEEVTILLSRYEYVNKLEVMKAPFNKGRLMIKDRQTGEVLGETVSFAVYPGWVDRILLGVIGFSWSPAGCDGDYKPRPQKSTLTITDLVTAVIKPKVSSKGDDS